MTETSEGDFHEKGVCLITSIEDHSPSMLEIAKVLFSSWNILYFQVEKLSSRERSNTKSKVKLIAKARRVTPGLQPPNLRAPFSRAHLLSLMAQSRFSSVFFPCLL